MKVSNGEILFPFVNSNNKRNILFHRVCCWILITIVFNIAFFEFFPRFKVCDFIFITILHTFSVNDSFSSDLKCQPALYSCTPLLLYSCNLYLCISVLLYCCILYSCPPILLYSVLRYSYTPVICSLYLVWSPSSIEPSNSLQSVRSSSTLYASPGFQGENGFVLSWLEMLRLVCLVGGETRRTWRMQWLGGVWGVRSMCGEDWERLRVESRESGLVWSLSPLLSHHLRLL